MAGEEYEETEESIMTIEELIYDSIDDIPRDEKGQIPPGTYLVREAGSLPVTGTSREDTIIKFQAGPL
jgi:hypothetical protein